MNDQALELRRKFNPDDNKRNAKTISIVSGKGGVGKSNFALNYSLALINKGKRVLLIDLDVGMGNINILLGLNVDKTIIDMMHDFLPIYSIIRKGPIGLDFISGGSGEKDLFSMNNDKKIFFIKEYTKLIGAYDYIIFDMGAGATNDSIFFVLASEECIVITTPEPTSITDSYSMIKHIIKHQREMPIYVVMNRCFTNKSDQQSLLKFKEVISTFLNITINPLGIIPDDRVVIKAVMEQKPYMLLNPKSPASKAVTVICERYLEGTSTKLDQKDATFIQKLTNFFKRSNHNGETKSTYN